jgi:Fe-S-cluster containining protein
MQFRAFLKNRLKMSNGELDGIVQETTDVVWAQVDCTACAHCCRTFEIVIDDRDIKRLAARLSVSLRSFLAQYVSTEKDGTKRFSSSPCPFLGEDNLCQVYEDRPQSCRDFPYLHTAGFRERSMTMMENVEACPIVFNVWQRLKRRLWRVNR